jgi:hypothetical protein
MKALLAHAELVGIFLGYQRSSHVSASESIMESILGMIKSYNRDY